MQNPGHHLQSHILWRYLYHHPRSFLFFHSFSHFAVRGKKKNVKLVLPCDAIEWAKVAENVLFLSSFFFLKSLCQLWIFFCRRNDKKKISTFQRYRNAYIEKSNWIHSLLKTHVFAWKNSNVSCKLCSSSTRPFIFIWDIFHRFLFYFNNRNFLWPFNRLVRATTRNEWKKNNVFKNDTIKRLINNNRMCFGRKKQFSHHWMWKKSLEFGRFPLCVGAKRKYS